MIVVAGTVSIQPEKREAAVGVVLKMVAATRPEAGCITYDFWSDLADPNRFHVFEEWETAETLEAHFQTAHMAEFLEAVPGLVASPPNIKRYEVASVTQLV